MHDSSQAGLVATKRQEWTIFSRDFCEDCENSSYLYFDVSNLCQKFLRFFFLFTFIVKNWKMFDRQSLVNVTLKIRTKFHSNRLVRYRGILHTVSKNLVSRETRLKFQKLHFSYVSFTYFFLLIFSRLAVLRISQLNWIQVP